MTVTQPYARLGCNVGTPIDGGRGLNPVIATARTEADAEAIVVALNQQAETTARLTDAEISLSAIADFGDGRTLGTVAERMREHADDFGKEGRLLRYRRIEARQQRKRIQHVVDAGQRRQRRLRYRD